MRTSIHRLIAAMSSASSAIWTKFTHYGSVAITKVKEASSLIRSKARVTITKVSDKTVGQVARPLGHTGAAFFRTWVGGMAIEVILRTAMNPSSVKKLWTDRKNNHRRVVSVAWSGLMLTGFSYYLRFVTPVVAIPALVGLGSAVVGYTVRRTFEYATGRRVLGVYHPVDKTDRRFRFAITLCWNLLAGYPMGMLFYTPDRLRSWLSPAYPVFSKTVDWDKVAAEVNKPSEEKTTVFDSKDAEGVFTVHEDEEKVEEIRVEGDTFRKDPRKAGTELAARLLSIGKDAAVEYRSHMARDLREAGLQAREVTFALQGFDTKMSVAV